MSVYQRVLSGIRPTGHIHLGNYLGAIHNWVRMAKNTKEQLFCIVDQHALTTVDDSKNLSDNTRTIAAAYIACGIDPNKSAIFAQSHVPAHTELGWYLNCFAPLGWLNRMTQFKDKAGKNSDRANLGLYAYPVLMAADILIYKATHVPVGEDQKQHVELARDLAGVFNNHANYDVFPLPEPIIPKETARIMSLRDGLSKMSKSDLSDYSRIHLLDDSDTIALKIRKAKTDSDSIPGTPKELEGRPEASNLLGIYAALSDQTIETLCVRFEGQTFSSVKQALTDILISSLTPIREKMLHLLQNPDELDKILYKGAETANSLAEQNLKEVRNALGLLPRIDQLRKV
ncbi:MAG: tryptophan--tRNA ligase [Alphaproteobacteria bacterium]|nr:tryptophan--tRNA ligase [Alphaproteobacteria bacterium]